MPANEEFFDVVNERDEIVGRATRREVHSRGLLHRAVHILAYNRNGEVFLQKRSLAKDMAPGLWDSSCSGHVDAGEDYDRSAVRELEEELGVRLSTAPPRWFRVEACAETGWEFAWIYRLNHSGPFLLDPVEIETGEWLAPVEVTLRIGANPELFAPAFRLIWGRASTSDD